MTEIIVRHPGCGLSVYQPDRELGHGPPGGAFICNLTQSLLNMGTESGDIQRSICGVVLARRLRWRECANRYHRAPRIPPASAIGRRDRSWLGAAMFRHRSYLQSSPTESLSSWLMTSGPRCCRALRAIEPRRPMLAPNGNGQARSNRATSATDLTCSKSKDYC